MKKIALTGLFSMLVLQGCSSQIAQAPVDFSKFQTQALVQTQQVPPVTGDMDVYHSKLGFSLAYPKKALRSGAKDENVVDFTTYEKGNVLYIAPAGLKSDFDKTYAPAPSDIPNYRGPEFLKGLASWIVHVSQDVKTDQDLDKVIKDAYGQACKLGQKIPTDQDGIYLVDIQGDGILDPGQSKCYINWQYKFYFDSKKQLAVYWDLGQEPQFWKDNTFKSAYDQVMMLNFHFE